MEILLIENVPCWNSSVRAAKLALALCSALISPLSPRGLFWAETMKRVGSNGRGTFFTHITPPVRRRNRGAIWGEVLVENCSRKLLEIRPCSSQWRRGLVREGLKVSEVRRGLLETLIECQFLFAQWKSVICQTLVLKTIRFLFKCPRWVGDVANCQQLLTALW